MCHLSVSIPHVLLNGTFAPDELPLVAIKLNEETGSSTFSLSAIKLPAANVRERGDKNYDKIVWKVDN